MRKIRHGAEGRVIKICRFDRLAQGQAGSDVSGQREGEEEGPTHLLKMHNVICKSGELESRVESSA